MFGSEVEGRDCWKSQPPVMAQMSGTPFLLLFLGLSWRGVTASLHGEHDQGEYDGFEGKPLWNATYTDQLKRDLLATYDKFARPAQHTNATKVFLDLVLRHVHLDDSKSLMTVNAWVRLAWKDEKLRWNVSDYGGLKMLHLADHEIWQPDIVLYNSALGNNIDHFGNTHCIAYPEGDVLWVPPSQFVVFCDLDLSRWPFDRQHCALRLGSWTYSGEQVDLQINQSRPHEQEPPEVTEWNVIDVTKRRSVTYYACCNEPYVDILFYITLERRSPSYRAVVIIPVICTLLLTLCSLWLPSHGRERYLLFGIALILIAIFLIYFTTRLPLIGPSTPIIILFYASSLLMVCTSVILTVVSHNLAQSQARLPRPLVNFLRGRLSSALLLPTPRLKTNYEEEMGVAAEELRDYDSGHDDKMILSRKSPQEGWNLVIAALDRIFFFTYMLVFLSLFLKAMI